MEKRWRVKKPDERLKAELAKRLGIHPVIAGLLVNRGITAAGEVESFLSSELSGLHSPLLLKDINPAVRRIKEAVEKKEKILIYGDYDADGVTSVALLYTILKKFTPNVIYYIPNRLEEGYDLNKDACGLAKSREVSLIITVDCGITAVDEVDYLNSLGIDIIITDHHQPQSELPKAHSIINPHQPGCEYPFKQLAGVGVAFKLAQALAGEFVDEPLLYLKPHLDLVAMGTIADVVPLLGENRILIKYGLEQLNQTKKTGLTSLIKSARLDEKVISAGHISFILAPRINAAGRIGSAEAALKLLLTGDELEAEALAKLLNDGNRQRQKIQEKTLKEALSLVEKDVNSKEHLVIVLSDDWHPGVVGIVASKLVDKFYRPAIIISTKKEPAKGSGRSINDFHLFDAVKNCAGHLCSFGGHKKACGVVIEKDKITDFREMINGFARASLSAEDLTPSLDAECEVSLREIDLSLLSGLDKLSPFGMGNPKPVFITRGLRLKDEPRALKRNGIKLLVSDGKITCEAVGFSLNDIDFNSLRGKTFSLAYNPSLNSYNGRDYITLNIKDVKIDGKY